MIAEHFPAASPSFLQRVAREFAQAASGKIGLFTAGSAEIGFFVCWPHGPGFPGDVQRLGREVASLLKAAGGRVRLPREKSPPFIIEKKRWAC